MFPHSLPLPVVFIPAVAVVASGASKATVTVRPTTASSEPEETVVFLLF